VEFVKINLCINTTLSSSLNTYQAPKIIVAGREKISSMPTLDGPGVESRERQEIYLFFIRSRLSLGHSQLPIQWVPVFFQGGKAAGA
jgi:hypothetical protein